MAEKIDNFKWFKLAIAFDVTWTYEIRFVIVVNIEGFPEIGIFAPFGNDLNRVIEV